jgi:hypothetical protein
MQQMSKLTVAKGRKTNIKLDVINHCHHSSLLAYGYPRTQAGKPRFRIRKTIL